MKYIYISYPDVNNGIGLRVTLWLSGCSHHCYRCQNPQTWDYDFGKYLEEKDRKRIFEILNKEYIDGITFSGGDPLYEYNVAELTGLIYEIKKNLPNKTIWLYTGFTWEDIFDKEENDLINTFRKEIIKMCDVVVDGEYVDKLRDITLPWRGSKNQRVILVKESLEAGKVIEMECE